MHIKFVVGGYYLVQGTQRLHWMDPSHVPSPFWSASSHICEVMPDAWILGWREDPQADKYRHLLGMDDAAFRRLQAEFNSLFQRGQYGFPNVFFSPEIARAFHSRYLTHLPQFKLLSIALEQAFSDALVEEDTPPDGIGESGIRHMLRAGTTPAGLGEFRGFEVLGYDGSGFCSFACNSLESDYHEKLGVVFNQNGLIDDYEVAKQAAEYTMLPEVGAEPHLWHPWLVTELPLAQ